MAFVRLGTINANNNLKIERHLPSGSAGVAFAKSHRNCCNHGVAKQTKK